MIVDFGGYVCLDSFARGWKLERCVTRDTPIHHKCVLSQGNW